AALKFSDAGQHGQHETAMRSRSVGPRIAERLEASAFLADQVDDPQQVERRARQPVELGHDQDVANLKLIERALQFRSLGGNAGHFLAEYPLSACGKEQRLLRRQSLPGRADAGVSIDCHFATPKGAPTCAGKIREGDPDLRWWILGGAPATAVAVQRAG